MNLIQLQKKWLNHHQKANLKKVRPNHLQFISYPLFVVKFTRKMILSTTLLFSIVGTRIIVFICNIVFRKHTARKDYEKLIKELDVKEWNDLIDHGKKDEDPSSSAAPNKESNQEVSK